MVRISNMKHHSTKYLKKISLIALLFAGSTGPASAHDFWLAPETYVMDSPGIVDVSVMIGHPKERLNWPVDPHRIVALRSIGPDGISDHQAAIADFEVSKTLPIRFETDGLYVLTVETTSAFSELQAEKFNAYVEEEGLTPIKIDRVLKEATEIPGTEIYSRRGKTLVQIGDISDVDPEYLTRPIGLTLEIVPLQNPARLGEGEMMSSRIYYRGNPMEGVTIGLIDLDSQDDKVVIEKTDSAGLVSFDRPEAGSWMLHAVWSDAMEDTSKADYDTIFSSLSFQVD